MKTTLYLVRHAATEAHVQDPARLLGRRQNQPLARIGVRQAELTRDFLALRPIDHCYCSPMLHAIQTASIIASPHGLAPIPLEALTECDVGAWDGLDWPTIRFLDAEGYRSYVQAPEQFRYPEGESLAQVQARVTAALEELWRKHEGQAILLVAHHLVHRVYLAGLLHLSPQQSNQLQVDPCGVSVVVRCDGVTTVNTLNASFHLHGLAA